MAIIREMERLLFTTNRPYTLGVHCLGLKWLFYVLRDSDSDGFKYKARHIYTHNLTKSYLSWLQLGVILQRLATYNLSCTRRLELLPKKEQSSLIDDIQRFKINAELKCDAKIKRRKKECLNKGDIVELKQDRERIWREVKDPVITREVYTVSFFKNHPGYWFILSIFGYSL